MGDDRLGRFWDSSNGKLSDVVLSGHGDRIRGCAFSPDGRFAATASDDRTARVWDVSTGECRLVLKGRDWAVLAVAYSADGARIATGSEDNRAIIWNADTGKLETVLKGHTAAITGDRFFSGWTTTLDWQLRPDSQALGYGHRKGSPHAQRSQPSNLGCRFLTRRSTRAHSEPGRHRHLVAECVEDVPGRMMTARASISGRDGTWTNTE